MYHTLYKITNLINHKIYVGIHSTNDLDDGYMGSGTALKRAYKKYGVESFNKEIIGFYESREQLERVEKSIVNNDFVQNRDTYNVQIGGSGNFIVSEEAKKRISIKNSGKVGSMNGKSKKVKNIKTGEVYESANLAAKATGVNYRTFLNRLKFNSKKNEFEYLSHVK